MSQRSPFRKKIAFADPETSMVGTKELRPKNLKRPKSGIDGNCFFPCFNDSENNRRLIEVL